MSTNRSVSSTMYPRRDAQSVPLKLALYQLLPHIYAVLFVATASLAALSAHTCIWHSAILNFVDCDADVALIFGDVCVAPLVKHKVRA